MMTGQLYDRLDVIDPGELEADFSLHAREYFLCQANAISPTPTTPTRWMRDVRREAAFSYFIYRTRTVGATEFMNSEHYRALEPHFTEFQERIRAYLNRKNLFKTIAANHSI
jgi:hypothetical protein